MKLLHIDSAATGAGSVTRELTAAIVARWQDAVPGLSVTYRDLDAQPLPHLTGPVLAKVDPAVADAGERTLQEFLDSDVIVIGAPMYNFSVPSTLKAWIDRVAVAGRTFRYTSEGPQGLAVGKKVIVVSTRGGVYAGTAYESAMDHQESYLRTVLNFLGMTDVTFVRAEGIAMKKDEAVATANRQIAELHVEYPRAA